MLQTYNPDVLTCLANLSSDEVFTPPSIANQMLDLLPQEIWRDPNATFLDPATKTGIFLREIAKRLMTGLEKEIPDKQKRFACLVVSMRARRFDCVPRLTLGTPLSAILALLNHRSK